MLLDFLKEIEKQRQDEEILEAVREEESKVIISGEEKLAEDHRMKVVPDIQAAQKTPCGVCNSKEHKYKCPKCAILYCSIACFQSHNQGQCNENFAQECVEEELKNQKSSIKARNKMNETLLRQYRGDEEEPDDEESKQEAISVERLEQLLQKVDLNPNEICETQLYNELNEEEKQDFNNFLSKNASQAIELWQPWWNYRTLFPTQAIQDLEAESE